ncbi:hypothetical protein BGX27_000712 [Mortierella sp. AM989]|nr:hypothetical protein BGX27_000712 [Mortierella sp. AM989]
MPKLRKMVKEPEMMIPSTTLSDLLITLKDQTQDDQGILDAKQLVGLNDIEKGSLETKRRQGQEVDVTIKLALNILQIVAPLCVADPIRRPVDTEQKSQAVWERVFNALFENTAVATVIGETGLEGSGEARTRNEIEYAVQQLDGETEGRKKKESHRKVDCKFVVSVERMKKWEFVTISNSEMKALRSSADEIEVMSFFLQIGRKLALQRLKSGSGGATHMSTYTNVRTFYTPKKDRLMPSPKKQPSPSPKKRRTSLDKYPMTGSSSTQMDPQMMKEPRKRRG